MSVLQKGQQFVNKASGRPGYVAEVRTTRNQRGVPIVRYRMSDADGNVYLDVHQVWERYEEAVSEQPSMSEKSR